MEAGEAPLEAIRGDFREPHSRGVLGLLLECELAPEAWPEAVPEAFRRLKELDFEVLLDALPDPESESDASAPDVARSRPGFGSCGDGLEGRGDDRGIYDSTPRVLPRGYRTYPLVAARVHFSQNPLFANPAKTRPHARPAASPAVPELSAYPCTPRDTALTKHSHNTAPAGHIGTD